MKRLIIVISIISSSQSFCYSQNNGDMIQDGVYYAWVKYCWETADAEIDCYTLIDECGDTTGIIHHLNIIEKCYDSIWHYQIPYKVTFEGDTIYSASDGGFFYARGWLQNNDSLYACMETYYTAYVILEDEFKYLLNFEQSNIDSEKLILNTKVLYLRGDQYLKRFNHFDLHRCLNDN